MIAVMATEEPHLTVALVAHEPPAVILLLVDPALVMERSCHERGMREGDGLTQVKENQAIFLLQCKMLQTQCLPLAETIGHEKEHGRVTTRSAYVFSLTSLTLDSRWKNRGLSTLIVVERETFESAKQKSTMETSYYVSNFVLESGVIKPLAEELSQLIRCH